MIILKSQRNKTRKILLLTQFCSILEIGCILFIGKENILTMKTYCYVVTIIFMSYVSCGYQSVRDGAQNTTEMEDVLCQHHKVSLLRTDRSSLIGLGGLTVDMVKALANDRDSREVNIKDMTKLVTALAESAVLVDNPKVCLTGCWIIQRYVYRQLDNPK